MAQSNQVRVSFFAPDSDELIASVWVAKTGKIEAKGEAKVDAVKSGKSAVNFGQRIEGPSVSPSPLANNGDVVLTLNHDYPDLKPMAGWLIKGRNLDLRIAAVDGLSLICREVN